MTNYTPQFSRRGDQDRKFYISDSSDYKLSFGHPSHNNKQVTENASQIEDGSCINENDKGQIYESFNKGYRDSEHDSENSRGSVIMGLLKQMVEASRLDEGLLKKNPKVSTEATSNRIKNTEEAVNHPIAEENPEDLEPRSIETVPPQTKKISKLVYLINPAHPADQKDIKPQSPLSRLQDRTKSPKPSKQERYENNYNACMEGIKKRYNTTLEYKRSKDQKEKQQMLAVIQKDLEADKENATPNIKPPQEQAGKIKRQRQENDNSIFLTTQMSSQSSRRENGSCKSNRSLFSAFQLSNDEISRIEKAQKETKLPHYFDSILATYAPRAPKAVVEFAECEFYEQPREEFVKAAASFGRVEIIQAVNHLQLYYHSSYLKEINESKSNIRKILASISKIQKENESVSEALKSNCTNKKKILLQKSTKDINLQENETKILLLKEMKNRLTQKIVIATLKFLRLARALRESLIEKCERHFTLNVCYYALAALYTYKQRTKESKKVQTVAIDAMRGIKKIVIWAKWRSFVQSCHEKTVNLAKAQSFRRTWMQRKAFSRLCLKSHYKKLIASSAKLSQEYFMRVRLARCFYAMKFASALLQQLSREKKKELAFERAQHEALLTEKLSTVYREIKKKRLVVLTSGREYHHDTIQKIRAFNSRKLRVSPGNVVKKFQLSNLNIVNQLADVPRLTSDQPGTLIRKNFIKPKQGQFSNLNLAATVSKNSHARLISNPDSLKEYLNDIITAWKNLRKGPAISTSRIKPLKSTAINISELRNVFVEKAKHRSITFAFIKWKEAFLEKCLEKKLDHFHISNFARHIIVHLKDFFAKQRERDFSNNQMADLKFASKFFDSWKNVEDIQLESKYPDLAMNYQRRFFQKWRKYSEIAEHKKNLYKYHLKAYYRRKIRAAFRKWCDMSQKNEDLRSFQDYIIKRRALQIWRKKFSGRMKLKQLFNIMFEAANCPVEEPTSKATLDLLQKIVKAWRYEVIENENTYQQKLNILAAQNHFSNKQKYKALSGWKLSTRFNKAFPLLIKNVKASLSRNVIQRWACSTRETRNILYYFEEGKEIRLVHRCFNALRTHILQEKLIRALTAKRFFSAWRSSHELTQYILPNKYHFQILLSKAFRALKVRQVKKINTFKKTLAANELTKHKDTRVQRMSFYSLIEYALKRKTKKLLHEKIVSFRQRFLKRKTMLSFKSYGYFKQVKEEKVRLVKNFRKRNKQLTLKIGSRFRVYPDFMSAASLLMSAWRAIALKSKNIQMITNRFRRFKNRIILRKHFMSWHDAFLKKAHKLGKFHDSFSKITTASTVKAGFEHTGFEQTGTSKFDKTKKSVRFEDEMANKTQSEASTHDISGFSLDDSGSHWLRIYHENEAFLRKLQDSRANDVSYGRKYY